ncbi:hypothetical protein AB4Y45_45905 [Paraburkholderia sp. EG287A]|uniref:hypothetical protein n=1 Tax=unclassified Paraburkholderia TaxID=2615204 RepID=UPI0034D32FCD
MDRIVEPVVKDKGGKAVAGPHESAGDRLLKYVPPDVAGFYAVAQAALASYSKDSLASLSASTLGIAILVACIAATYVLLNRQMKSKALQANVKQRLLLSQFTISVIALLVWSYSINSYIWGGLYKSPIAIIATGIFVMFAGIHVPTITAAEKQQSPGTTTGQ